jgi:hypothetical protein
MSCGLLRTVVNNRSFARLTNKYGTDLPPLFGHGYSRRLARRAALPLALRSRATCYTAV